jgi:hypothetical protein
MSIVQRGAACGRFGQRLTRICLLCSCPTPNYSSRSIAERAGGAACSQQSAGSAVVQVATLPLPRVAWNLIFIKTSSALLTSYSYCYLLLAALLWHLAFGIG